MKKRIAVISTMDTKAAEAEFISGIIRARGHEPVLIDVGPLSRPECAADYSNLDVAGYAGKDLRRLIKTGPRDKIMRNMAIGAEKILQKLYAEGTLDGVLGLGGNQGSSIAAAAMRGLPIGFPKFLVSTVASGNIRPYIGYTDIVITFSVSDLVGGVNPVSRAILSNAAASVIGMAESGERVKNSEPEKTIALSALGNTESSAARIFHALRSQGYEVITFHASGAGGSAMEDLIEKGVFGGVMDLTTHELAEEVAGVGVYVPIKTGRLTAAGKRGIPQVVSFGGLEYFCGGTRDSILPAYRKRKIYMHNPLNANIKLVTAEMKEVGLRMAVRLNTAKGPVHLVVPLRGWSVYGAKGGPFYDPKGADTLLKALYTKLNTKKIKIQEVDAHINDEAFSDVCSAAMIDAMKVKYGGIV
ncbi:MAG: Tm-1-like ATP-binding domain-containing protein [Spirochaetales bacterium]|jgi:uncharacterized protein (UPF0261 family)|nr:Tm-1-like ATP-binding domain-containing protein [Spirochaetales bacterium]